MQKWSTPFRFWYECKLKKNILNKKKAICLCFIKNSYVNIQNMYILYIYFPVKIRYRIDLCTE